MICDHMSEEPTAAARKALGELRAAMEQIRHAHPAYRPGTEPTAADNCKYVLEMLDHGIEQIRVYLA